MDSIKETTEIQSQETMDSGYLSELLSGSLSELSVPYVSGDSGINLEEQRQEPSGKWKAIYRQDENGDTLLHRLLASSDTSRSRIYAALMEIIRGTPHPDLLDIENDWGQTALHVACEHEDEASARILICAGATANRPDSRLFTPLHIAACKGNLALIRAIVRPIGQEEMAACALTLYSVTAGETRTKFPEVSYLCSRGMTPLHLAIAAGSHDCVKELLPFATSTNSQDMLEGRTALHLACDLRRPDIVRTLLTFGVAVNDEDFAGKTALERALHQRFAPKRDPGHEVDEIVLLLRSFGAIASEDEDSDEDCSEDEDERRSRPGESFQRGVACV